MNLKLSSIPAMIRSGSCILQLVWKKAAVNVESNPYVNFGCF